MSVKPNVIKYREHEFYWMNEYVDENGVPFKSSREIRGGKSRGINRILWCPDCEKGARLQDWGFPYEEGRTYVINTGVCPHCGKSMTMRYFKDVDIWYGEDDEPRLSETFQCEYVLMNGIQYQAVELGFAPRLELHSLKWWPITQKNLTFDIVHKEVKGGTMYEKYWVHTRLAHQRIVLNLEKGLVYAKRPKYRDGKYVDVKVCGQKAALITVSDKFGSMVPHRAHEDFCRIFAEEMAKLGYETSYSPGNYANIRFNGRDCHISNIPQMFYCRDCRGYNYLDLLYFRVHRLGNGPMAIRNLIPRFRELATKGEVAWLPKYMQKPSIRRRLLERAALYLYYKWMYAMGIRDINVMNTVVDDLSYNNEDLWRIFPYMEDDAVRMFKHYIQGKPASSVTKFLTSSVREYNQLRDTVRMYNRFIRNQYRLPENPGSLTELHDMFSKNLRAEQNQIIPIADEEKVFNTQIDNLVFTVAPDTMTLFNIGQSMHICVGSYDRFAVSKACTIVSVQNKNTGKYVACIELRRNEQEFRLAQLKAFANEAVGDEITVITQWLTQSNIIYQNNYDYQWAMRNYNFKHNNAA